MQALISLLENAGELIRIKTYVNTDLEIAEITDRISKSNNNKALLFENTGYDFPVLMNAYGSYKRMCMILGVNNMDDISKEIEHLLKSLTQPKQGLLDKLGALSELGKISSWMPKQISGKGECQEVIMQNPNINKLPVLKCWPQDGGKFITLPIIHTQDPITKQRNVGMYRMQVFDDTTTGMHWHKHKVSAKHFNEYKKLNKKMPVAVALGGDAIYAYCATAPLPENIDEYILAGFLRKKKVELVKCISQPEIYVPADADFIIEGYIDPSEDLLWEGPFGDHTGFYSLPDWYPAFHITAITHKKNAIYPATIVGIPPQEDAWLGKATERIFLTPIKMTLSPEVIDMDMPIEGVFHNLVIAKIQKDYAGQALKVMSAFWGAGQMMFNKILVLISNDYNSVNDYWDIIKKGLQQFNPHQDLHLGYGPMDVLDHSCNKAGIGGKMCVDLTQKFEDEINDFYTQLPFNTNISTQELQKIFTNISALNTRLISQNIPVLIVFVKKTQKGEIKKLHTQLCQHPLLIGMKAFIYLDHFMQSDNLSTIAWITCNNIDPKRDTIITDYETMHNDKNMTLCAVGIDATIKRKQTDDFYRDWPNVIISNDETIKAVDDKWHNLNIGEFIPSPSLQFKNMVLSQRAEV